MKTEICWTAHGGRTCLFNSRAELFLLTLTSHPLAHCYFCTSSIRPATQLQWYTCNHQNKRETSRYLFFFFFFHSIFFLCGFACTVPGAVPVPQEPGSSGVQREVAMPNWHFFRLIKIHGVRGRGQRETRNVRRKIDWASSQFALYSVPFEMWLCCFTLCYKQQIAHVAFWRLLYSRNFVLYALWSAFIKIWRDS